MTGVIFLPPRPKRRHVSSVLARMRSVLSRGPGPWQRAAAPDPVVELGRPGPGGPRRGPPRPGELRVQCRRRDGRHVIALSGALNLATRDPFVEAFEAAVEDEEGQIVLDLSDLESIDYGGVGAILTAQLRASDELKLLLICPGPPAVQRVLDAVRGPFLYVSSHDRRGGRRARARLGRTVPSRLGRAARDRSVRRSG